MAPGSEGRCRLCGGDRLRVFLSFGVFRRQRQLLRFGAMAISFQAGGHRRLERHRLEVEDLVPRFDARQAEQIKDEGM